MIFVYFYSEHSEAYLCKRKKSPPKNAEKITFLHFSYHLPNLHPPPPPLHTHLPPQPPSHSHPREQGEQKPRAPPVELRHIPLGRQLYYLFLHPHIHHGIAFHACTPSISPFHPREIHRISSLPLADEDTIAEEYRIAGMDSCTSHTSSTSNGGRAKAFATREGKEYCSQAQCQDENR